jgi:DNA-binding FadR family transcriptional regulator
LNDTKAAENFVKSSPNGARRPVQTPKLSHLIAGDLRAKIASSELAPGDSLPPESELLAQFGISRPTLREALRILESDKLIRLGRGARSGATILGASVEAAARHSAMYLASHGATLADIHEVRMLIEPSLAAMLALRAKKEHIKALRQCVSAQQAALETRDYATAIKAVQDFHSIMARSSENRALGLFSGVLQEMSVRVYPKMLVTGSAGDRQIARRRTEESAAAHRKLVDLIIHSKSREAEEFWAAYMAETEAFLVRTGLAKLRVELRAEY